jgi:hypothetical protein
MVISVTQSSKIEFADWFGVLAQPVVAGRFFDEIRAALVPPWGRRALIPLNGSCLLVVYSGHSASVLRNSAVYLQ